MIMKKTNINLIPDCVNPSPDYYCTWQTQLYATCDGKPKAQRAIITEKALFDEEKPLGWAYFYEKARNDLFFVMDDSWDVPVIDDPTCYGSLILNKEKFPGFVTDTKDNVQALKKLSDKIKSLGWKGLGGWVCAQESEKFAGDATPEEYWTQRTKDARNSGFAYWKVDWGKKANDIEFRKMLTALGKKYASDLIIEHAVIKDIIPYADVFRTYDVPAVMSIPMTMVKLKEILYSGKTDAVFPGIVNCEDEAYIAAAGGFSMGIMRHPYDGAFVNGTPDMSFPEVHRNLKTKMYEVIRAVRWHRIAPAFGIDCNKIFIDKNELRDTWRFKNKAEEIEEWWFSVPAFCDSIRDGVVTKFAPARISRNCKLPEVTADENGNVPYVIASKNPNGAFSVATLGRTLERKYEIPKCDVFISAQDSEIIAAFGEYKNLIIETAYAKIDSVLMQDPADDYAYDISESIVYNDNKIIIPGTLIKKIGTISQPEKDTSEPGVIIRVYSR